MWIWPPFAVYRLTHQWGFYASSLVYCALLLLLAARIVERPTRLDVGLLGLTIGLAVWESEQLIPVIVPVVGWTAWRRRDALRDAWIGVLCFVIGALPSIVWNVRHDWGSLSPPIPDTTTYQHRLRVFFSPLLPMMLGVRVPFSQRMLLPSVVGLAILAAVLVLFALGAWRARGTNASLLYLTAVVFPFLYAVSPETAFVAEPRYLLVLVPVLVLLVAQLARDYRSGLVVLAVAAVASVPVLQRMDTYVRTVPLTPPRAPRDLHPLVRVLDGLRLDRVYADFWVSYRLDFETGERIVAAQNKLARATFVDGAAIASHHPHPRYRGYERQVDAAARRGFVFFRVDTARSQELITALRRHRYRRVSVGPFVVYAPPAAAGAARTP
jgi:hypothetical protein